jgi:hypothetical protein
MKNLFFVTICTLAFWGANAQNVQNREVALLFSIDTKGLTVDAEQMGALARIELEKLNLYEVLSQYDVAYVLSKKQITPATCFSKQCLVDVGKELKADKVFSGSVDYYSDRINVTLRMIDVGTETIEKVETMDFLAIRTQIHVMLGLVLQKMLGQPMNEELLSKLTKLDGYENALNVPETERLRLNGPRMGFTVFSGANADIIKAKEALGGFDGTPMMFQFGYQFEVAYLNQGNFQALFEFIPTITGLDQGKFFPSITFLNGFRESRYGIEFAFGPSIAMTKTAPGFYDSEGNWLLQNEWETVNPGVTRPNTFEKRWDSRGNPDVNSSFVFALGKTFRSGRLNIPINAYMVPNKNGHRFGLSIGFNARKR